MVMKPEPIFRAIRSTIGTTGTPIILLSPQGRTFTQAIAQELAQQPRIAFLCGHYEGVDERVRQHLVTEELSIGDYVLTGGELAAMVIIDAVARFIPGVLGAANGAHDDSYTSGLLEGPHYTRPAIFEDWSVPEVLRSGNHAKIARWQRKMSLKRTFERRPDLLAGGALAPQDQQLLIEIRQEVGEPDEVG